MDCSECRVAVLQNYLTSEIGGKHMLQNILRLINIHAPIQGDDFPNLDDHDLIILTGGPFNLLEHEQPLWVTDTLKFIKTATTNRAEPKLLGICWGQQAIALALGGSIGLSKSGLCIGVETISLTSDGASFFKTASLDIHKHHNLIVNDTGPYLSCLASNNEILLSNDKQVLSFQGHPELEASLSQTFASLGDSSSSSRSKLRAGFKPIDAPHDGEAIFARIVEWASRKCNF
ncbi:class I glutamine amidotransferase-like protein [Polychaeton citri CBS 116435]|uniref:Class I glutamine amidotransferase-like protein n=1 Tax=Polychaeton citri CBS 116435 TaxID=1314669 RepID=A0A9P4UMQ9_9PEZI|nr:class I glutamine amidotransferase-like protein [Polychaeton citri CBS 116435]